MIPTYNCFIIMPFGQTTKKHTETHWTRHFEGFLKPIVEQNPGMIVRRSSPLRGNMLSQIITDLVSADVVIADITDSNANVFWELGVRQSFKNGTILIREKATKRLPFDLSINRAIFYTDSHLEQVAFSQSLRAAVTDCLQNPHKIDSQVLETLSGRGSFFEIFRKDETTRRLDALISECESNLGIFKHLKKCIEDRKENPKNKTVLTLRLRSSSTELLVTNRYINAEKQFFIDAENQLVMVEGVNSRLNIWQDSHEAVDEWLSKNIVAFESSINDFLKNIKIEQERVVRSL